MSSDWRSPPSKLHARQPEGVVECHLVFEVLMRHYCISIIIVFLWINFNSGIIWDIFRSDKDCNLIISC